ncbi:MAG: hypothetical protein KH123_08695, partial [Azospirillum sp.]|nr:hypothetical protein [Azospirillum sp.]
HVHAYFSFRHCRPFFFSSVIPVLDTGICKGDVRLKPKHDIEKKAEHNKEKRSNMTKNKAPLPRGFGFIYCPATAY